MLIDFFMGNEVILRRVIIVGTYQKTVQQQLHYFKTFSRTASWVITESIIVPQTIGENKVQLRNMSFLRREARADQRSSYTFGEWPFYFALCTVSQYASWSMVIFFGYGTRGTVGKRVRAHRSNWRSKSFRVQGARVRCYQSPVFFTSGSTDFDIIF